MMQFNARQLFNSHPLLIAIILVAFASQSVGCPFEQLPLIVEDSGRYGLISCDGRVVKPFDYFEISAFNEHGLARAGTFSNGKFGCIDVAGETVVPLVWERLRLLEDGTIWASSSEVTSLFDERGNLLATWPFPCDSPWNATGLAVQCQGANCVLVDMRGIPTGRSWNSLVAIGQNQGFIAEEWNVDGLRSHYSLLDKNGRLVTLPLAGPILGVYPQKFPQEWILLNVASKFGYVDDTFRISIPFEWDYLGSFTLFKSGATSVCRAERNGQQTFIDMEGSEIIEPTSTRYFDFTPFGYARYSSRNEGLGWIVRDELSRLHLTADSITDFCSFRVAEFEQQGRFGCINDSGVVVVAPKYDLICFADQPAKQAIHAVAGRDWTAFSPDGNVLWTLKVPAEVASLETQSGGIVASLTHPTRIRGYKALPLISRLGPLKNPVEGMIRPLMHPYQQTIVVSHSGRILWVSPRPYSNAETALLCIATLVIAGVAWMARDRIKVLVSRIYRRQQAP